MNNRAGQSLMELLIGMAVAAVFIVGSSSIIISSLQSSGTVLGIQIQAQLAQELLNNTKAWADGNWNALLALATGTANTYYLDTATSPFTILPGTIPNPYTYTRTITINSPEASGTQTNFPMLFSATYSWLAASSSGGFIQNLVTAPNGGQEPADLVFATSTANCGTANLNFETESYTSSTGAIADWINVPSISSGTVIYICYDDSSAKTDQSHPSSTWNSNYVAVYHFPTPTSTLNVMDSTANGNSGTAVGTTTPVTGIIDGGMNLTYSAPNHVSISGITLAGDFTISGWNNIISCSSDSSCNGDTIFGVTNNQNSLNAYGRDWRLYDGGGDEVYGTAAVAYNTWHYITVTRSGTNLAIYIDGTLNNTGSGSTHTFTFYTIGSSGVSDPSGSYDSDEDRIASVALSPSWVLSEYNNQNSPSTFYTLGSATSGTGRISTSTFESIVNNGVTYDRDFYMSDVYRDSSGNVTTTASGNFDDPSTKLITATVSAASSSIPAASYSIYLTRNASNNLAQSSWAGASSTAVTRFINNNYGSASGTIIGTGGSLSLATSSGGGGGGGPSLNGYSYARSITVASSEVSSTNTNFPMLFSATYSWLEASSSGGHIQNLVTAPNGGKEPADLIFTSDSGCSSPLNFETESYVSSTGAIADWVNVPTLNSSTIVYACYGNNSITTDQSHPSSTWNSNYGGVWHFPTPTSTVQGNDSTNNAINLGAGTNIVATTTQIDGGFNLLNINAANGFELSTTSLNYQRSFSITAWINTSDGVNNQAIISHQVSGYYLRVANGQLDFLSSQVADLGHGNTSFSTNQWYYVGITVSSGGTATGTFYVNGVPDGTINFNNAFGNYDPISIGHEYGGGEHFTGDIDEVRVASTTLSPSWILTEYNNQSSPSTFYTVGSEQTAGGAPTQVQRVQVDASGYNAGETVTLPTSTIAGDTIIVSFLGQNAGSLGGYSVSDGTNGTYQVAATSSDTDGDFYSLMYYMSNASSTTSVTVTVPYSWWYAEIYEYSGLKSAGSLDQSAVEDGPTYGSVTNWSAPLTTTAAGDLVVGSGEMPDFAVPNTSTYNIDWFPASSSGWGPIFASGIASSTGSYPFEGTASDYGRVALSAASFFAGSSAAPSASGTLSSQPFDTGLASGTQLNSLIWQGSEPAGTTVKFQIAVSNASSGPWNFVGPDGTSNTYFSGNPGTPISLFSTTNGYSLFNGYRYFAYQISLYTPDDTTVPTVSSVNVNWSP